MRLKFEEKESAVAKMVSHNKQLIENQIKEVKTWVLTKLLKEREFNRTEIELRSKDILKDWYRESERRMKKEKDSWMEDIEKLRTNADYVRELRKEMMLMKEENLRETEKLIEEMKKLRKEDERQKK
ncbi:hypothetical protein AOLI_G00125530 [Acnodon oligacanthus]